MVLNMTRINRFLFPLLCVFMVFAMSISAAAIDLGVTGSTSITTDQAYDRIFQYLGGYDTEAEQSGFKLEHDAVQTTDNMVRIAYIDDYSLGGAEYYWLVWADDSGTLQLAYIDVDANTGEEELQFCTDPRVTVSDSDTDEVSSSGSSSGSIAEKGFSDASSFLSVVGEIATFIVNNELCLISLSFVFIFRGIRLLRKTLRVTPR